MLARHRHSAAHLIADLALGATAGAAASWVMGKSQGAIAKLGTKRTLEAEQRAGENAGEPATEKLADVVATSVGVSLPDEQRELAGELVHYATGTVWGALFGAALAHRKSRLGRAAIFATLLWLFQDELLVPLLGLANGPKAFPLTTHLKALLAHLVYGESVAGVVALLG